MVNSGNEKSVGNYLLTECRGEDHIAQVCTGIEKTTGRKVIVRIVDPLVARNPRVRKALDELLSASSSRRVIDPHVLTILDAGVENETYFIVHEDFGGVALNEYLQHNRLTTAERLKLARSIFECIRAIHGYRIIHGDFKPQNIFVKHDSVERPLVKVALADMAYQASDAMVSIYGELVGTPKYLSPEQIKGERAAEGSDLFSAGIILYELFCEQEPFPSQSTLGYLHTNLAVMPRPLSKDVSPEMGKVILRLLANETRNRYRNAQAVLDDLDRVEASISGGKVERALPGADSAFAAAPEARLERAPMRLPVILGISFLAVLVIVLIVTLIFFGAGRISVTPQPVQPQKEAQPEEPPVRKPPEKQGAASAEELKAAFLVAQGKSSELVQAGKLREAVSFWQDFSKRHEKDALAELAQKESAAAGLFEKGSELWKAQKKSAEAIETLNQVIGNFPDSDWAIGAGRLIPEILFESAKEFESRAEIAKAVEGFESLIQEYPGSPAAEDAGQILPGLKVRLAQAIQAAQPDRAISILREVVSSNGDEAATARKMLAGILFKRSESLAQQEKYKEALADLRESGGLDSSLRFRVMAREPELLAQAALKTKDKQDVVEAVALWKELLQRFPNDAAVKQHEAEMSPLLSAASQPNVETSKGPDQSDAVALWNLADQELKNNNFASAEPYLEKLAKDFAGTTEGTKAADALAGNLYDGAMAKGLSGDVKGEREFLSQVTARYGTTRFAAAAVRELSRIQKAPQGMVYVPAGPATIGLSKERLAQVVKEFSVPSFMVTRWLGVQQPAHEVKTNSYYIDQKPVTNAQYKAFIDATNRKPPISADWSGTEIKAGRQKYPVTDVAWNDAAAYARWSGKRLPSEVEWEKAARGVDGRLFPWGDKFDAKLAPAGASSALGVMPVGAIPEAASPYGALDMAGNVKEWTNDEFKPYPGVDAEGLGFTENQKAVRGASWDASFPVFCLTTTRTGAMPDTHSPNVGFRCAKDVE